MNHEFNSQEWLELLATCKIDYKGGEMVYILHDENVRKMILDGGAWKETDDYWTLIRKTQYEIDEYLGLPKVRPQWTGLKPKKRL